MFRREIFPFLSFKLLQRVKTLARDETEKDSQIQISADISRLWRNFYAETPWCEVLFELEGVQRPCLQRPLGARFSENKWRKMREKLGERRKIIFETRLLKMAGNDLLREPRYRVNWLWKSRLPIPSVTRAWIRGSWFRKKATVILLEKLRRRNEEMNFNINFLSFVLR